LSRLIGVGAASPWGGVVRAAPTGEILAYMAGQWERFAARFSGEGEPFHERDEPALTSGLGQFLIDAAMAQAQPFPGDFHFELRRCRLGPDGKITTIGRTDLEWRLWGFSALVVEFKILGPGRRTRPYLTEGLVRFVDGRYAPGAHEGAMCALVRPCPPGVDPVAELEGLLDRDGANYRCAPSGGTTRHAPSTLAPTIARFDTLHDREAPMPGIRLAHLFLPVPEPMA
jgi:hypothetical protein